MVGGHVAQAFTVAQEHMCRVFFQAAFLEAFGKGKIIRRATIMATIHGFSDMTMKLGLCTVPVSTG